MDSSPAPWTIWEGSYRLEHLGPTDLFSWTLCENVRLSDYNSIFFKLNLLALGLHSRIICLNLGSFMRPNTLNFDNCSGGPFSRTIRWSVGSFARAVDNTNDITLHTHVTSTYNPCIDHKCISYHVIYLYSLYSLCIMHSLGDKGSKEVQLEETQTIDAIDEPPTEQSQGRPLCIPLFANAQCDYG
jgi:hypothetical protein